MFEGPIPFKKSCLVRQKNKDVTFSMVHLSNYM